MANAGVKASLPSELYEADFHAWAERQARALREGRWADLDVENVAEEIESLGRSSRHQIESRMEVLVAHLLKYLVQPRMRTVSWEATIGEQRRRIAKLLGENPSLKHFPAASLADVYEGALAKAVFETGMLEDQFPSSCPFTIDQVLDPGFLPETSGLFGQ